jgi:hypothetical protein
MLRGPQEIEAVATLEHRATGAVQVDGQPCKVTAYANMVTQIRH